MAATNIAQEISRLTIGVGGAGNMLPGVFVRSADIQQKYLSICEEGFESLGIEVIALTAGTQPAEEDGYKRDEFLHGDNTLAAIKIRKCIPACKFFFIILLFDKNCQNAVVLLYR